MKKRSYSSGARKSSYWKDFWIEVGESIFSTFMIITVLFLPPILIIGAMVMVCR